VTEQKSFVFTFADVEVRQREFLLIKAGKALAVEPKAFRVLLFLLRNPGRLVTKDEILNAVWNDCSVSDNSLTRSIATLRRLLDDDTRDPKYIATVPTVGYRFRCPVTVSEESLATPSKSIHGPADQKAGKRAGVQSSEFVDSIAVLPFESAGHKTEMAYLSDGITASIISNLSQLHRVRVVPRTTVFRYRSNGEPARAGRELSVRLVVTGQVALHGEALIINVELIDAIHESQLWGANYNCRLEDIFEVQAEIVGQITKRLRLQIDDEAKRQLAKRPTESRDAYFLYLKAVHWANKMSAEGMRKSVDYIREAIDLDAAYAEAWSALAYIYVMIGYVGGGPATETFARAKAAAVKALEIDNGEADAHAALAFVRILYDWDWQSAQEELLCALELKPDLAGGHFVYSNWYLTQRLFEEALTEAKIALDIDPLSVLLSYNVGFIHYCSQHYDEAIEQFHKSSELDPLFAPTHQFLAFAYAQKRMRPEALGELEKGLKFAKDDIRIKALSGIVDALTGRTREARDVLGKLRQELGPQSFSPAYHCAVLHALLGEKDEAFACLEIARQGRSNRIAYLAVAPNFESLYGDPRFADLLFRIGIPVLLEPGT
jgi:TolB-like protein/Flp pilus assembly protein TadD